MARIPDLPPAAPKSALFALRRHLSRSLRMPLRATDIVMVDMRQVVHPDDGVRRATRVSGSPMRTCRRRPERNCDGNARTGFDPAVAPEPYASTVQELVGAAALKAQILAPTPAVLLIRCGDGPIARRGPQGTHCRARRGHLSDAHNPEDGERITASDYGRSALMRR
jgi:hypothetical protein